MYSFLRPTVQLTDTSIWALSDKKRKGKKRGEGRGKERREDRGEEKGNQIT